jgi:hypothetical protein
LVGWRDKEEENLEETAAMEMGAGVGVTSQDLRQEIERKPMCALHSCI